MFCIDLARCQWTQVCLPPLLHLRAPALGTGDKLLHGRGPLPHFRLSPSLPSGCTAPLQGAGVLFGVAFLLSCAYVNTVDWALVWAPVSSASRWLLSTDLWGGHVPVPPVTMECHLDWSFHIQTSVSLTVDLQRVSASLTIRVLFLKQGLPSGLVVMWWEKELRAHPFGTHLVRRSWITGPLGNGSR